MSDVHDWEELVERHLRGELSDAEKERLAELLDSDVTVRQTFVEHVQWDTRFSEVLREGGDAQADPNAAVVETATTPPEWSSKLTFMKILLAVSAVAIVALLAGLSYQRSNTNRRIAEIKKSNQSPVAEPPIARIIGLSGTLIWTGDRGQVVRDVQVGTKLPGGTIEGMAPDSWFELEFNDGSTMMISGTSTVTFADVGQKVLRLREGILSANVVPQPADKPMLIYTRSALLEVLGTQFDVEASLASTVLNVREGKVRLKRLSDGSEVDVPAKHRVTAGDDDEMTPVQILVSVHDWKSHLHLGLDDACGNYGKWSPASGEQPASMKAIPFVPQENRSITLYLLGLPVVRSDGSPVIVKPGSRFVVRGRLTNAEDVLLGIRVSHVNGEFAGKFLARQPAVQFQDDSRFEAVFQLSDFALDPCVRDRKDELAARPDDLILNGIWSFTYTGGPSGLEIMEVELIPPEQPAADAR
jgi:hypothetical protein